MNDAFTKDFFAAVESGYRLMSISLIRFNPLSVALNLDGVFGDLLFPVDRFARTIEIVGDIRIIDIFSKPGPASVNLGPGTPALRDARPCP